MCCSGCSVNRERTLVWLLCRSGERLHFVRLCYGCCISHERINLSVVPMAPQVFCQPLSLRFVYANSAHSEIQLDSAAHKLKSSTAGVVGRIPSRPGSRGRRWMEEASGRHITCGTGWLQSSWCGLQWKTGKQ